MSSILPAVTDGDLDLPQGKWARWMRRIYPAGFKKETINLLKIAIPVILTNFFSFLIMTESVMLCGHLAKNELDGAALGNSIINALGLSVATGLSTACDTFFSQIYGSPYKKRMGMMLQRSLLVMTLFPFFIIAVFINMEPIFIGLGQDPEVAELAANYMALFSPGVLFAFHFLALARYMQNQDVVLPPMIIVIVANVFNVVSQYICLYVLELGFNSSAICQMFTYILMWLMEVLYIYFSKLYRETWDGWTKEAFLDWGAFFSLGVPGIAMVVMETFCWEIGTFLSGLLGTTELASQSVLFQLETITFQIAFGVAVAVNIRVGQNLGSQEPKRALTAYRCGLTVMFVSSCVTGSLFAILSEELPKLFTKDTVVITETSKIIAILIFVQITDSQNTVTLGALRGCGRQRLGTLFIFIAYYLLGQPIGISLAFLTDLKVTGLWIGLLCALIIIVPPAMIVANRQDWAYYAERAQERVNTTKSTEDALAQYDENTSLLDHDDLLPRRRKSGGGAHQRMPSQPRFSSLSVVPLPQVHSPSNEKYGKYIIRRAIIFLVALGVLAAGILLKVYLPRESYFPYRNTTTAPTAADLEDDYYLSPDFS